MIITVVCSFLGQERACISSTGLPKAHAKLGQEMVEKSLAYLREAIK